MESNAVLVYTNSKERAVQFASMLGGVSIGNVIASYETLDQYHDILLKMLEDDGFLITVFNGVPHIIVGSDTATFEYFRMVDYDPEFKDINNRPIPFPPNGENMSIKTVNQELERHIETYFGFIKRGVRRYINAATDDTDGELGYFGFKYMLDRVCDEHKYVRLTVTGARDYSLDNYYRARPRSMTQKAVREAFTTLDIGRERLRTIDAAVLQKQINWLIAANSSNLLYQKTGKMFLVGRMECALLHFISEREKLCRRVHGHYKVVGKLKAKTDSGKEVTLPVDAFFQTDFRSKDEAEKAIATLPKAFICEHTHFNKKAYDDARLYSAFSLQVAASNLLNVAMEEAQAIIQRLYSGGYITWPNESDTLPWRFRGECKSAVTFLAKRAKYHGKITQKDVDTFNSWDMETAEETELNHTGIIVSKYADERSGLSDAELTVYDLVASRFVEIFSQPMTEVSVAISANAVDLRIFASDRFTYTTNTPSKTDMNREELYKSFATVRSGGAVELVDSRIVENNFTHPFTEVSLVEALLDMFGGAYYNDIRYFSKVINTLYDWKLVTKDENGYLHLTKKGRVEDIYIDGLSLANLSDAIDWDRRVQQSIKAPERFKDESGKTVEETDKQGADFVVDDVYVYLDDLAEELTNRYEELIGTEDIAIEECLCPICGELVKKAPDGGWKCSNDECSFTIPAAHYGHILTWRDVWHLLSRGYTERHDDFVSQKSNNSYTARIVFAKGHQLSVSFNAPFPCPICGKPLQEWQWSVKCSNANACKFSLNTRVCGVALTDELLAPLLTHQKTPLIHNFKNKSGKVFAAKLYLDGATLKFDFPPKEAAQGKGNSATSET